MAHLIEPLEMRDQLYDFSPTTPCSLRSPPEQVAPRRGPTRDRPGRLPGRRGDALRVERDGDLADLRGTDRRRLLLCVHLLQGEHRRRGRMTSTDQAVRLANLVELVLRSNDGRALSYGGNTAAQGVATPEMRIRVARKDTDLKKWYSTVYIRVEITNIRGQIS